MGNTILSTSLREWRQEAVTMATNRLESALDTIDSLLNELNAVGMFVHGPKQKSTRRKQSKRSSAFGHNGKSYPIRRSQQCWRDMLTNSASGVATSSVDDAWAQQVNTLDHQLTKEI